MKTKQAWDTFAALRDRYGIELDTKAWESKHLPEGVGLPDELVGKLASAALQFEDRVAVAYELESSRKEFAPLSVSLDEAGFDALRRAMLSHFDIVLVPPSRKWALLMSHELEGLLLGPEHFLAQV